jgi:copper transport protein
MGLPARRPAELTRFSRAVPIALVVMAATGILLAVLQVRRLDAFWTTNYGLVLSAKLSAVAALLALAALNRYVLTLRVVGSNGTAARRLAGSSVAEVLIALVVLGLVASRRFTPPPRALLAAAEAAVHLHIHTDGAMADVTWKIYSRFDRSGAGQATETMRSTCAWDRPVYSDQPANLPRGLLSR